MKARHVLGAALSGALAVALSPSASAQAPDLDAETVDAVAELIFAVLPDDVSADGISWDAAAVRASPRQGLHWHLAAPDAYEGEFSGPDAYRRSGWIETTGRQISVAACGTADAITGLAFRFRDEDAGEALAAALTAQGATVEQIGETIPGVSDYSDFRIDPAERSMRYAVAAAGRPPASFGAAVSCTPVGSRAARMCWTNVSFAFTPDDPQGIACVNPGRY